MNEIIFIVKESPEGGYEGRALGYSIFVEGDTYEEIKETFGTQFIAILMRIPQRLSGYILQKKKFLRHEENPTGYYWL
ncbi:hypothetical protein [Anaerophaga thermohalophila]|uniref:hypothetical protein n=1 Tax=Anaerophaga thermohalophila TaxID=177400 RepID=UPI000237C0B9|nr:hypothetical protein [Anaerophaga thermohalophila]